MNPEELPKRARILRAFYDEVFKADVPEAWRKTARYPIIRILPPDCPAFYVFDHMEQVVEQPRPRREIIRAEIGLILEIFITHSLSEDAADRLQCMLEPIQRALLDNNLGGLVQGVWETGSKIAIESVEQRLISCEVSFRASYFRDYRK